MSASAALQTAIFDALVADASVHGFVADRIYDNVPARSRFPYVSFGPSQEIEDDEECIDGEEHYFQIDVWDQSQARLAPAKLICGAVKAALHRAPLTLPDPYALVFIRVDETRTMLDPDGKTSHGMVMVRAALEI